MLPAMGRPKTKGPQIPLRLSLATHAEVARRAAEWDLSVREYVELWIEQLVRS
jgi:hypothetical protein